MKEILIKGLANSKTFQRFAVRTDAHIRNLKQTSNEQINSKLDELHKAASRSAYSSGSASKAGGNATSGGSSGPPKEPLSGFAGFIAAFGKEIRKDLGLGK